MTREEREKNVQDVLDRSPMPRRCRETVIDRIVDELHRTIDRLHLTGWGSIPEALTAVEQLRQSERGLLEACKQSLTDLEHLDGDGKLTAVAHIHTRRKLGHAIAFAEPPEVPAEGGGD